MSAALDLLRDLNQNWPQCPWCGVVRPEPPHDPRLDAPDEWKGTMREWLALVQQAEAAPLLPLPHTEDCRLVRVLAGRDEDAERADRLWFMLQAATRVDK